MRVLNYGLGTNSTALLVEAVKRGIRIDIIVAADTGDEHRYSYNYALEVMDPFLAAHAQPKITWVKWIRKDGSFVSISDMCLRNRDLPSKAYGLSGCTSKWKQQPVDKFLRNHPDVQSEVARGGGGGWSSVGSATTTTSRLVPSGCSPRIHSLTEWSKDKRFPFHIGGGCVHSWTGRWAAQNAFRPSSRLACVCQARVPA